MRIEKIILAIAGIFAGLFVAGIAFYIYQTTKTISPTSIKTITLEKPTPAANSVPLAISQPADESVTTSRTVQINGKSSPQATIVVSTDTTDAVVSPSSDGNFSLTQTLSVGENRVIITAIMPDGTENQQILTVNVTSEDF